MDHYYTSNPESKSNEREIDYSVNDINLKLITDNGVFSKAHVDIATSFMLKVISNEKFGESILDLGCGYGVIGITIGKINPNAQITMCDINTRALDLAKRNATKNRVTNIKVIESDGFANVEDTFDSIITNPPIRAGKAVIYKMYEDSFKHLKDGGKLYLVINKKHGAPSTLEYLKTLFADVKVMDKKNGFNVIRCIKRA